MITKFTKTQQYKHYEEMQRGLFVHLYNNATQTQGGSDMFGNVVEDLGPCVATYPFWHPLTNSMFGNGGDPASLGGQIQPKFNRFVCFRDGFVVFPSDWDELENLERCCSQAYSSSGVKFSSYILNPADEKLRSSRRVSSCERARRKKFEMFDYLHCVAGLSFEKDPVLADMHSQGECNAIVAVRCNWPVKSNKDGTLPNNIAVRLMLTSLIRATSASAMSWDNIRPYLVGMPNSASSSVFVDALSMKQLEDCYRSVHVSGALEAVI